ncbi:amidohydrolase [Anaerovorax odorimutans]|uniref:Amidohydrolase n=1 Tax=Anaerovorax odorimutans TaxID=109327 RepID=A0ABT1RQ30_9FIRM|nr:amidohydrolase [Anaerovorax odorimutans]MCQ4637309.1 amidohydrolase [Anaerovorax odorimutans]
MSARKIYTNGRIFTVNENRDWADTVVIEGNKIVYVGDKTGADTFWDSGAEVLDLKGKMMLPGFIDGHCHPVMASHYLCGVYLQVEWGVEECLAEIKKFVGENPDNDTYFGIGYAEWIFDENGPKKELLDEICADKPMMILGSSAHEAWVNTKALELAGITKDTPDPIPGFHYFHRDAAGNPTGHLLEMGPQNMIMEQVNFFDPDKIEEALAKASDEYAAMGVTAVCDMGAPEFVMKAYFETVPAMMENGTYKQRMTGCGRMVSDKSDVDIVFPRLLDYKTRYDTDNFRINFLKIINDGTLETRSAALSKPYDEDGSMVEPLFNRQELAELGLKAAEAGLDINVHGIGDEAISGTLAMAKAIRQAGYDDCRIVNSHCDYVKDEELELFGKYNVIANTTCVWHYGNPDMEKVIGDRQNHTFRLKSMIKGGCRMGQGSDFPVDEFGREPLKGIEMGCSRQLFDHPELPVLKPYEEKLSVDDGIASYTINNAYQMHMEDKLGSIEAGKYADLVILEKNIFEVPVSEIHKVKVCETIMDGKTVYKAGDSQ